MLPTGAATAAIATAAIIEITAKTQPSGKVPLYA
jgi:hypothetical protein